MASSDFIATQQSTYPDLAAAYGNLDELLSKKLFHQLTEALLAFAKDPRHNRGDNLLQLYESFVAPAEGRLSQLRVVQFVASVAQQLYPSRPYNADEIDRAIALVSRQLARRQRVGEERLADDAYLAGTMEVTTLKVRKATAMAASGAPAAALDALLDECKREVEEGKAALDALPDGTEPSVAAAVHRASAEYFKLRGPAHAFYESALLFLGNTPLEALPAEERVSLAVDVALAALVGKGVYNFGEVNAHPLLVSLEGTPHAWLGELLRAFQHGDIDAFNACVAANREAFEAAPALISSAGAMKEKITLLAVMELAARKPSGERAIAFEEVATEVRLPLEQVEWVLMRALSLGLIRGSIDEVGRSVAVSFVRPRVLDAAQIGVLRERVGAWRDKAGTMLQHMEEHTREIFK